MSVRRAIGAAAIYGVVVLTAPPLRAHHSTAALYDSSRKVQLQGTITRFTIRNPHSMLYFETIDDGGRAVEWQVELGPTASVLSIGWNADRLKPGTVIKVSGQPSRAPGSHGICCVTITYPDGRPIVDWNAPKPSGVR